MRLFRFQLRPSSPWRTPWQADTLLGALCSTCARTHGPDFLRRRLIDPMLAGEPPFVLSDAFPGRFLPLPAVLRLAPPPPGTNHKAFKQARWISADIFHAVRGGRAAAPEHCLADADFFADEPRRHNTLSRANDAPSAEGGLFSRPDSMLGQTAPANGADSLSIYARCQADDALDLLLDLFGELSLTGFGADIATGRGQFAIIEAPAPVVDFDTLLPGANAVVCLSTFQPASADPTDGCWEAFPKFGKVGPDLGLPDVRKRTLIMFRPGACFKTDAPQRPFLGRALPMDLILPPEIAATLRGRSIEIVHPAFGLTIPAKLCWPEEAIG